MLYYLFIHIHKGSTVRTLLSAEDLVTGNQTDKLIFNIMQTKQ